MNIKDYHTIIGVNPGATASEIRKAYLKRSKVLHPDRFDPKTQPAEWELANEMLRDLNEAYEALCDNQRETQSSASPPSPKDTRGEARQSESRPKSGTTPPRTEFRKVGPLRSGVAYWDTLTKGVRARMNDRHEGKVSPQLKIELNRLTGNYVCLFAALGWAIFLIMTINNDRWTIDERHSYFWISMVASGFFSYNLCAIWRARICRIPNNLIVTPLYFLITEFDQIRYYPLWEIKEFGVTHHYRNRSYSRSAVRLVFPFRDESLILARKNDGDQLIEAVNVFRKKIQSAKDSDDLSYFIDEDDFREVQPEDKRMRRLEGIHYGCFWGLSVIGFLITVAICVGLNMERFPMPPPVGYTTPTFDPSTAVPESAPSVTPTPTPTPISYPVEDMPANGTYWSSCSPETLVAPLQITTRAGGGNYYVKVEDWNTGTVIMTFLVYEGTTMTEHVPLGSYRVKYAVGRTWYGIDHLFGPDTAYAKADEKMDFTQDSQGYNGHTLELFMQPNGNLNTTNIRPEEF
jgi:hypothetical protein